MNEEKDKESKLAESPLFGDIPNEKWVEIERILKKKTIPAKTIIYRQGDPGDNFYIINSGEIRVFRKDRIGFEIELSQLGPGESFGEIALLTDKPRTANVETLEKTELTVLSKDQFNRVVKEYPQVSLSFIKQMAQWLIRDELRLEQEAQRQFWLHGLSIFDFILIGCLSVVCGIFFNQINPDGIPLIPKLRYEESVSYVSATMAIEKYRKGEALFIDARPTNFYEQQHIKDAKNLPLATFDDTYEIEEFDKLDKAKEIIVSGRTRISTRYGEQVARELMRFGHTNVKLLEGGLSRWKKQGYPVEP